MVDKEPFSSLVPFGSYMQSYRAHSFYKHVSLLNSPQQLSTVSLPFTGDDLLEWAGPYVFTVFLSAECLATIIILLTEGFEMSPIHSHSEDKGNLDLKVV